MSDWKTEAQALGERHGVKVSTHHPMAADDRKFNFDEGIDFVYASWSAPARALFARLIEALGRGEWPGEVRAYDVDEVNAGQWSIFHAVWGRGSQGHGETMLHVDGSLVATGSTHEGIDGLLARAFQTHRGDLEPRLEELGYRLVEDQAQANSVRTRLATLAATEGRNYKQALKSARVFAGPRGAHFVELRFIGTAGAYLPSSSSPLWIGSAWSSRGAFIWLHEQGLEDGLVAHVSEIHEPDEYGVIIDRLRMRAHPSAERRIHAGVGSIGPFVGLEVWALAGTLARLGLSSCATVRFEAVAASETPMVVSDPEWRALRREYRRALVADDGETAARLKAELAERYGDEEP